ncbi:(2Fe-2S)-binding protein [Hyphomicrobiales bacterium]|nr:(2Fe-2S)-binding protein [Hyphomicrobiales bacterium]CAH1693195.1 (2Fe-2S)-binding protein [Hyphomicrobiales bacterium]
MFQVHPDVLSPMVSIMINGERIQAREGELVASVLLRTEPYCARTTPVGDAPRAPYCLMGVCFDCLAIVDGMQSVQTCMLPVRAGMVIERQRGARKIAS